MIMSSRPRSVIIAVALQLLTVVPFLLGTYVVLRFGAAAQHAAEAEVVRQGLPAEILILHGIDFGGSETLAIVLVLILVTLAMLNLAGKRIGRILSWIFHPILFAMGVVIIPGQLFTTQLLESSIKRFGDPALARVDVPALVDAAADAMPGWLPAATIAKLMLTTVGSVVVIVLLAAPSARRYFRTHQKGAPVSRENLI
ncbi:hypothetical protein AB0M54_47250 [Actinoplanes sp. NPDC051470]|uniref:hypothetical protein n=1 Tax=Actinoplanes sp. NPDC051470 TaxID=3157224 RepID=UPI00344AC254